MNDDEMVPVTTTYVKVSRPLRLSRSLRFRFWLADLRWARRTSKRTDLPMRDLLRDKRELQDATAKQVQRELFFGKPE